MKDSFSTIEGRVTEGAAPAPRELTDGRSRDRAEELARRMLDIVAASSSLILLSPLMLVVAILIKLDSPGAALFRQVRIGIDRRKRRRLTSRVDRREEDLLGKPFTFYKFRTMYADSRKRFPELYDYDHSEEELRSLPMKLLMGRKNGSPTMAEGASQPDLAAAINDPRVPPISRWLRTTSLDELPNLINVLKGDMHLVGPRADLPEHMKYYDRRARKKLSVKPGITGLAQVSGRGRLSFQETIQYDVEYVENRSLLLDMKLLIRTISVFLSRNGAF